MTRLVIFDLDGTLINSLLDLANAANYTLKQHGLPEHETDEYKYFVGNGIYKLVERMTPESSRSDKMLLASLKSNFDSYYANHSNDCTKPYDGVLDVLDTLRDQGIKCAVLSNKPHEFTAKLCKQYFGSRIDLAIGHREGYPHKPDKALVQEILTHFQVDCEQCLYVGDSGVDMQTAKNAQVFAVGALWGFRSEEELTTNGADVLASSPIKMMKILEETS